MKLRAMARMFAVGLCAAGVAGCGSYFAATGVERTPGVETIGIGASRDTVEEILGDPVASDTTESGIVARYRYDRGRAGESLGIEGPAMEVYAFVFQPLVWLWVAGEYYEQKGTLRITYGPDETVTEIGRLLNAADFEKEQNSRDVFQKFLKGAECGDGEDQFRVGRMYETGAGPPGEKMHGSMYVRRDIRQAYLWYAIAAAQQAKYAVEYRDAAAGKMRPEHIAEAERLAAAWQPDPASCKVAAGTAMGEG